MILETILLLLLPVAGWLGWWLARLSSKRAENKRSRQLSNRYFQGLNYLLNEQPDKAIQIFTQMAEVNSDTVEMHLALGSLFRKRGEVDRAIRLHQNIIGKRNLDEQQRTLALLELGEDYMRAGLFDRAEKLFGELAERDIQAPSALRNLLDIYQQEKEWARALEVAQALEKLEPQGMGTAMSHFCCELADDALQQGETELARRHLRRARRHDPESARAEFLAARIAESSGDYEAALEAYEKVVELDSDHLRELLDPYFEAARKGDQSHRAHERLVEWAGQHDGISLVIRRTEIMAHERGQKEAIEYLKAHLTERPSVRGLYHLLEMEGTETESLDTSEQILGRIAHSLASSQSEYRCRNCGFSGHQHHWQCPSCKRWGVTGVIRGVLGE